MKTILLAPLCAAALLLGGCASAPLADNSSAYQEDILRLSKEHREKTLSGDFQFRVGDRVVATGDEAVALHASNPLGRLWAPYVRTKFWGANMDVPIEEYRWNAGAGERWHCAQPSLAYIDWEGAPYYEITWHGAQLSIFPDYPGERGCRIHYEGKWFPLLRMGTTPNTQYLHVERPLTKKELIRLLEGKWPKYEADKPEGLLPRVWRSVKRGVALAVPAPVNPVILWDAADGNDATMDDLFADTRLDSRTWTDEEWRLARESNARGEAHRESMRRFHPVPGPQGSLME